MFCTSCAEHYKTDAQQQKSNTFITGSDNFRLSSLEDHSTSKTHKKAHEVISVKEKVVHIEDTEAGKALSKLREAERDRLSLLFRNAHALAKNNRPIADFNWLCEIDKAKGLDIGSTYGNVKAATAFISSIAEIERKASAKTLTEAPFFSFMMDGSTDVAGDEQETIYIRCSFQGNITEQFLDMSSPPSTKSQDLYDHVINVLEKNKISKEKLIAMGSDGASNMVGKRSGLSTLLRENVNSEMVNVHCLCHRLELAFRDVIKPIKLYDKVMTLLIGLYYFYKKSYKNKQGLRRAIEAVKQGVYPTKVTGTRWLPHLLRAILAMLKTYNALEAHLSTASHDNAKAGGLLKLLLDKQVMAFILFLKDALEPAMRLSLRLQRPGAVIGESLCWVESTIEILTDKQERTSTALQHLLDTGEFNGVALKGPTPSTAFADRILKGFCDAIKDRFQTEAVNVLNASKILKFGNWPEPGTDDLKGYGNEEIGQVYHHFHQSLTRVQPNITEERLLDEWNLLKKIITRKYTLKNLQWTTVFEDNEGITLIMLLVDLMLTIPLTSVACETTFSQLKLLKTCRRSRLGPSVLNDLMMVKLQSPAITAFQPDKAIDHWMSTTKSTRKLTYKRTKKTVLRATPASASAASPVVISDEEDVLVESRPEPVAGASTVNEPEPEPELSAVIPSEPVATSESERSESAGSEVEELEPIPSISRGPYLSIEEELDMLCDKGFDLDAEEECHDFQNELTNFSMLMDFGRE